MRVVRFVVLRFFHSGVSGVRFSHVLAVDLHELGHKAEVNKVHVNDLHATILHQLGLDHEKLTYTYAGRRFRLADVGGHVIRVLSASLGAISRSRSPTK